MTRLIMILSVLVIMENNGYNFKQGRDGCGLFHIAPNTLQDYNLATGQNLTAQDLLDPEVAWDCAEGIITEIYKLPYETDEELIELGRRWNNSHEFGVRLMNLVKAKEGKHGR